MQNKKLNDYNRFLNHLLNLGCLVIHFFNKITNLVLIN